MVRVTCGGEWWRISGEGLSELNKGVDELVFWAFWFWLGVVNSILRVFVGVELAVGGSSVSSSPGRESGEKVVVK